MLQQNHFQKYIYLSGIAFLLLIVIVLLQTDNYVQARDSESTATDPTLERLPHRPALITFSQYQHLAHYERTRFGELVWFWVADTFQGPVHSNEQMGINGGVFMHLVSTGAPSFLGSFANATYMRGYRLRARYIAFPARAYELRNAAANSGTWLNSVNGQYRFVLVLQGTSASVFRWSVLDSSSTTSGQPFLTTQWTTTAPYAIFCDGELWIKGLVEGKLGVGASRTIKLLDDVKYVDCQHFPYIPSLTSPNFLTLISEDANRPSTNSPRRGVIIAHTVENGVTGGRANVADSSHLRDIVITAQIVALRGSFSFEYQNDVWEPQATLPNPYGTNNDERGDIFLRGAVASFHRDYVHRSNLGGTGYAKRYRYDQRFFRTSAPFVPKVPESDGWELE